MSEAAALQTLADWLQRHRAALQLTQAEAADTIGVSRISYGSWERDSARPRRSHWNAIARWLGIPVEAVADILGEPGPLPEATTELPTSTKGAVQTLSRRYARAVEPPTAEAARSAYERGRRLREQGLLDQAEEALGGADAAFGEIADPSGQSSARLELSRVARLRGQLPVAQTWATAALYQARQAGDRLAQASAQVELGRIEKQTSGSSAASAHFDAARQLFEEAGSERGIAIVRGEIAKVLNERGRLNEAAEELLAALDHFDVDDLDPGYRSSLRTDLALVQRRLGDSEAARESLLSAERISREANRPLDLGRAHFELGRTERLVGNLDRAQDWLMQALVDYANAGPLERANVHWELGRVALDRDDTRLAKEHLLAAHQLYADIGNSTGRANVLNSLASAAAAAGDPHGAADYAARALAQHLLADNALGTGTTLHQLGRIAFDAQQYTVARALLEGAIRAANIAGSLTNESLSQSRLAEILKRLGDLDGAAAAARESLRLLRARASSGSADQASLYEFRERIRQRALVIGEMARDEELIRQARSTPEDVQG